MLILSIFDGTNIHGTIIHRKTFDASCVMITYPIYSQLSKIWLALQFSIFLVSSFIEDLLFISFQQKNEIKKENTLTEFNIYFFFSGIDLFDVKVFNRNLIDGNLIRKCVLKRIWRWSFHG